MIGCGTGGTSISSISFETYTGSSVVTRIWSFEVFVSTGGMFSVVGVAGWNSWTIDCVDREETGRRCWLIERRVGFVWLLLRVDELGRRFFSGWVRNGALTWAGTKRRTFCTWVDGVTDDGGGGGDAVELADEGRAVDELFGRWTWELFVGTSGITVDGCFGFFSLTFYWIEGEGVIHTGLLELTSIARFALSMILAAKRISSTSIQTTEELETILTMCERNSCYQLAVVVEEEVQELFLIY